MIGIARHIAEMCPNGVPHESLGSIGSIVRGKRFVKADLVDEGVPCLHYGEIYTRYGISAHRSFSFLTQERAKTMRFAKPGDVVLVSAGESIEDIGKSVAWLGTQPIAIHDACYAFSSPLDPKYVSYFFASRLFRDQIRQDIASSKISSVSTQNLARARIPVPPLEVQQTIVGVLDDFTELEAGLAAKLEAELDARQRQRIQCLESLLDPDKIDGLRWRSLGELLRVPLSNGRSVQTGTGYPVLRLTALHGPVVDVTQYKYGAWDENEGRRFRIEAGDILMARGNGTVGLLARACMVEEPAEIAFPDTMIRLRPDLDIVSQRYLYYLWGTTRVRTEIERKAKATSGVWKISQADIASVVLPIPPMDQQLRAVEALERLDALASDLSFGLRAELAARRKQYEYYRDKLLTFEEAPA